MNNQFSVSNANKIKRAKKKITFKKRKAVKKIKQHFRLVKARYQFKILKFLNNIEGVHNNEIWNAMLIIIALITDNYALLYALMQSGKTDSYLLAAFYLFEKNYCDEIIITGGWSDNSLKNDLESSAKSMAGRWVKSGNAELLKERGINHQIKHYENIVKVYMNKDLSKIEEFCPKTLIINDESHYGQSKDQSYDKFMKKHGINNILYDPKVRSKANLKEKDLYYISVSATPFAEAISNDKYHKKKRIIHGEPGHTYIGVESHYNNERIKFIKMENIIDVVKRIIIPELLSCEENKYSIIRIHGKKHKNFAEEIKNIIDNDHVDIKSMSSQKASVDYNNLDFLSESPSKNTLVIIWGAARMGKVLNKKYIKSVIESSIEPKIDTTLQGLLGRMCGYDVPEDISIYLSDKKDILKKGIEDYIRKDISFKAMNVSPKNSNLKSNCLFIYSEDNQVFRKTIPYHIDNTNYDKVFDEHTFQLSQFNNLIEDKFHPDIFLNERQNFRSWKGKNRFSHYDLQNDTYKKDNVVKKFHENIKSKTPFTYNKTNFITTKKKDDIGEFDIAIFVDKINKFAFICIVIHMPLEIKPDLKANVSKKSNYSPESYENEAEIKFESNGQNPRNMPPESEYDKSVFLEYMEDTIIHKTNSRSANFDKYTSKRIDSNYDNSKKKYTGLAFRKNIYKSKDELKNLLINKFKDEFPEIKFDLKGRNGRPKEGCFMLLHISWNHNN